MRLHDFHRPTDHLLGLRERVRFPGERTWYVDIVWSEYNGYRQTSEYYKAFSRF